MLLLCPFLSDHINSLIHFQTHMNTREKGRCRRAWFQKNERPKEEIAPINEEEVFTPTHSRILAW